MKDLPFLASDNFFHITYDYVVIVVIVKFVPILYLDLYISNVLNQNANVVVTLILQS